MGPTEARYITRPADSPLTLPQDSAVLSSSLSSRRTHGVLVAAAFRLSTPMPVVGLENAISRGLRMLFVAGLLSWGLGPMSHELCLGAEPDTAGIEFFENHIRPVLVQHCYECHAAGADSTKGGLRVDHQTSLLRGGESGAAVVPGDIKNSLLISAMKQQDFEMPPEGKLPDETIRRFEQWVRMGAPMPKSAPDVDESKKSAEHHWAFKSAQRKPLPEVQDSAWPRSEVDHFVLTRLEREGLTVNGDVDRRTLIRRACFDLWGIPPTQEQVAEFLQDDSPQAFESLVDRLLESPNFGQRWGRHWLDVARYAESTGHERNFLHPHAWRYRDYVIKSFNKDKAYDRFITEQLAGDQLAAENDAENDAERDEALTATGFLALGPKNLLGNKAVFPHDMADDQINVTMRAISGLTVSCARCHDHKFDPISTKEYYGLAGIFLSTETLYGTKPGTGGGNNAHPSDLIPIGPDAETRHAVMKKHDEKVAAATKEYAKVFGALKKLLSQPKKKQEQLVSEIAVARSRTSKRRKELDDLKNNAPESPIYVMGVRDAEKIRDTQVRVSGIRPGDVVPRRVLECCTTGNAPAIPRKASGRLELAQWLVNANHPLTARVMVNRIWHHLFGRGLVSTVDNFGINGRLPSHPELLDWLAIRFQDDGWSVKKTIRRLMLSRVYQLSSAHNEKNLVVDPDNILLWRRSPRRLDAEAIRDTMLMIASRLEFSPPVDGSVVAELGDGCIVRQINPDGLLTDTGCRSVYLPAVRFFEPELLQVFDGASASLVVGSRSTTNVPAQALFLLNDDFVIDQSKAAADRILQEPNLDQTARIELAWQCTFGRKPTESETDRANEYLRQSLGKSTDDKVSSKLIWAGMFQALFASAEFRHCY